MFSTRKYINRGCLFSSRKPKLLAKELTFLASGHYKLKVQADNGWLLH